MCTGHPPFRADSAVAVLRRVSDDRPRPVREINPEIPDWLEAIVERLHAKSPCGRYQSAAEVAEVLSQCLAHVREPLSVALPRELSAALLAIAIARSISNAPVLAWLSGVAAVGAVLAWAVVGDTGPRVRRCLFGARGAIRSRASRRTVARSAPRPTKSPSASTTPGAPSRRSRRA